MNILIVNTIDKGGAAKACIRLHESLLKQGLKSKLLLRDRSKVRPHVYRFVNKSSSNSKLKILKIKFINALRLLGVFKNNRPHANLVFKKNRSKDLDYFSFPNSLYDITKSPLYEEADIINLHWVADFLDYKTFFKKNTKPVVWTLHDMNPFTGGEHFLQTMVGMDKNGQPIKRLLTNTEKKVFIENIELKQLALAQVKNLNIVAPSKWLAREAKSSTIFSKYDVHSIPYGLDSKVFQPRDQKLSRDLFQIPHDKKIILFVADSLGNHRKGFTFLKLAFEKMDRADVVLCAVGDKYNNLDSRSNLIQLGLITDELLMSMAYSAADVFIIPSLMDNLPNTVLESLMCGTPVIGFPVGGIPDMVEHGVNGLLTKSIDSASLVETIASFLESINRFDRNKIRANALSKYDSNIQARSYMNLFDKIANH